MEDADLRAVAQRAAAGDAHAFAVLVRATQTDVRRTCAALVDRQSADDLTQETYLRAHQSLHRYRGAASVRTWLLAIARHVCLSELRARTRRRRLVRSIPPPAHVGDPTGAVDLQATISALPADRREAFVLTQLVGLSYAEAAAVCHCPVGTIRSRVARARADLLTAMKEREQRRA